MESILQNRALKIVAIYHLPYSMRNPVTDNTFIDELTDWLTDTLASDKHVLVLGNFNIHINKENNEMSAIFLNFMTAMGLQCSYPFPTHKDDGNCLDLIFTESIGDIMITAYKPITYISEHQIVAGNISIPKDDITRKEIIYRKLKSINYTDLAEEMHLDSLLLENLEYNDLVRKFENNMKDALNTIAPEVTKMITVRHKKTWFTEELRTQKKIVRREKIYEKYGQHHQWLALRVEMAKYKRMIWNLWKKKLVRGNTKQLYNLVSKLTSNPTIEPSSRRDTKQ